MPHITHTYEYTQKLYTLLLLAYFKMKSGAGRGGWDVGAEEIVKLGVTALLHADLSLTEVKSLPWPPSEAVTDSAMVMPIRRPSCWDKVSKDAEGRAGPSPRHLL